MRGFNLIYIRFAGMAAALSILSIATAQPLLQWQKALGGTASDYANDIQQTADGGYVLTGGTSSNNGDVAGHHGNGDVWVAKLDNAGSLQWQKSLGGSAPDVGYSIRQTTDGGYIVAGYTGSNNGNVSGYHGLRDAWVVKLDNTGAVQWQRCLGGSVYDEAYSVLQTADGGYMIAGYTGSTNGDVSGNHGIYDAWIVKLNSTGVLQWQKCIGGSGSDFAYAIQPTSDGGFAVVANTQSNDGDVSGNHGNWDIWALKLDAAGVLQWQKCLGGSGADQGYSLLQSSDGGYAIAGYTGSTNGDVSGNHGAQDGWVVKLSNMGSLQWQKCLGGTLADQTYSIVQSADGNYIVAGLVKSNNGDVGGNHGGDDAWMVELGPTGGLHWQKCLGGTEADGAYAIRSTTDGGYILAGSTASNNGDVSGNHGGGDAWAVKMGCGNQVRVIITTDANPGQITWEITDVGNVPIATGGPAATEANQVVTETVCLGAVPVSACYGFRIMDSFGDGIAAGNWQLRTTTGKLLLRDEFTGGSVSPFASPLTPGYISHSFCLPEGIAKPAANECGVFNNGLGNKVYSVAVPGATQYEFEFSDPDSGLVLRVTSTHNYVHFWDIPAPGLIPGVKYFTRVRTNAAGPLASAHFGTGCQMGLSVPVTVRCSELINAPAYGHSCNETRAFGTNNSFIHAKPVTGASEYQFRIYNLSEVYDTIITRNTNILQLKWNGNPLQNGSTYNVEVQVKVNGLYSGFCPGSCTITIANPGPRPVARMAEASFGEAVMWPNPVQGRQVNLSLSGLNAGVPAGDPALTPQQIAVDVQDIHGKQVFRKEYVNTGDRFTTVVELPGYITTGVYMVIITVNGNRTVQRLSVYR